MAGLKKKKKEKSGSPNTVLVVFLVLFVLISIGLGVWVYYAINEREEMRTKLNTASQSEKGMKRTAEYYEMLYGDLKEAVGLITPDEQQSMALFRDQFLTPGFGAYKDQKTNAQAKKTMEDLHELLDGSKDPKNYGKNLIAELKQAKAEVDDKAAQLNKQIAKNTRVENVYQSMGAKQDTFQTNALKQIQQGNALALKEAQVRSEEFKDLQKQLKEREKDIADVKGTMQERDDDHNRALNKLVLQNKQLAQELAETKAEGAKGGLNAARGDSSPLLLDISTGRPIWDGPVGKIVRVEPDLRTVMINIGQAQGVKPELTFMIFANNGVNRAIGQLKGSIEIVKVLDASTSVARITSLYGVDGTEIGFNDPPRSRIVRESEAPIKEGDLLFNMFWGARVAIAGYVSMTGELSDNPADQIKQTQDFIRLLELQGMRVDAYVDLSDGQVKGQITSKTRYLILGDKLMAEKTKAAPKAAEGDDEKKEPAKEGPATERAELINKAVDALRRDAGEKGSLVISAENFATMIGYRKPHSAARDLASRFVPRLPYAGTYVGSVSAPAAPAAPQAPMEPKKDMEKKDENP